MRLLFIILFFSLTAQSQINIIIGKPYLPVTVEGLAIDDGWYNAFPFPGQRPVAILSFYKKSADHASKGPLTLTKSTNGGATWNEGQIEVDATPIECAALSVGYLPTRICIAYQDDEDYTSTKFAYSDDEGATFTDAGSLSFGAGYSSSLSPVKMVVMPSGKIYCAYYKFGTGGNPSIVGLMESTDNGESWSFGPEIFSHDGTGFGDDKGHEVAFCITDNTGSDATTKLMALIRNADASPYMHYTSSDGGATWDTDIVTVDNPGSFSRHYLYKFTGASNQSPVDIAVHNGLLYVVNGYRDYGSGSFKLQFITASVADAFENNHYNWSEKTTLVTTDENDVHFGYPIMFKDWQNKLWCQYYDVSPEDNISLGTPRVLIKQIKIAD